MRMRYGQGWIKTGTWWALLRRPDGLPVLFATREQARENCDPDEYPVRVTVTAANPSRRWRKWGRLKPIMRRMAQTGERE